MRIGRFRFERGKARERLRERRRRLRCNCKTDGENGGGGGAAAILNELAARGNGTNKKLDDKAESVHFGMKLFLFLFGSPVL